MKKIVIMALMATLVLANVGKVAVVKGEATINRDVKVIKVRNGMGLLKQDVVQTEQGRMQMLFNDNTVISLGKESRFVIKEYLYGKNSEKVAATFKIEKGFVKIITGAINKVVPNLFVLETATTSITPHGTVWSVDVNDESEVYKVLEGRVTLSFNDGTDRKVDLNAGESALLKKSADGTVASFTKSQINKRSLGYENNIETNTALIKEEHYRNTGAVDDTSGNSVDDTSGNPEDDTSGNPEDDTSGNPEDDGNNGHENDPGKFDPSNPGQG